MLTQFVEREMEEIELKDVVEPDLMHRILTSIYGSVDALTPGKRVAPWLSGFRGRAPGFESSSRVVR